MYTNTKEYKAIGLPFKFVYLEKKYAKPYALLYHDEVM